MTHSFIHKILGLALLVGVFCAFLTPSHAAERTRSRSGTYTTSSGKSGTFKSTTTRGNGVREQETARANQDGATATRTVEITRPDGTTETHTQTFAITKEPAPAS